MKLIQPAEEVLMSWRRCMESGISSKAPAPALNVKDEVLELKKGENSLLIAVFNDCTSRINCLLTNKHLLLLVNPEGILLKICNSKLIKKKYSNRRGCGIYGGEQRNKCDFHVSDIEKTDLYIP